MGTVLEKANKIKETKNKLKEAINDGGGQITNNTVFNDYANEIKDIYIDAINNGTENIYDNFPKITGDGSEIILNTEEGPLKITLEGNTSQDGTPTPDNPVDVNVVTGENNVKVENKNIFIVDDFITAMSTNYQGTETIDGVECIALGRRNSTTTSYKYFLNCKENTQYTISFKYTLDNCTIYFKYSDNSTSVITDTTTSSLTSISVTSTANKTITAINVDCFGWFDTGSKILITDIQLEAGSTATEYVEHQEQNYPISLSSKNLFKPYTNTGSVTSNGVVYTMNNDNTITLNGTATGNTWVEILENFRASVQTSTTKHLNLDSTKTYTIKANIISGTYTGQTRFYTQINSSGGEVYSNLNNSSSIANSDGLYRAWFRVFNGDVFDNLKIGIQLEIGPATDYTPYFNPIEYCKIGDYTDQFIRTSGKNLFNIEGNINTRYNGTIGNYNSLEGNNLITTYSTNDGYPYGQRIYVGAGNKITISGIVTNINSTGSKNALIMCFNDNTTTGAQSIVFDNTEINIRKSFSFTADTDYVIVAFAGRYSGFVSAIFTNIQVEYGETLSEYEPYGLNEWHLKKNIDKVTFDGSDDEVYEKVYGSIYNNKCIFYLRNIPHNNSNYRLMKSNRFVATSGVSEYYPEGINVSYNSGFLGLVLIADRLTEYSANALKTFFQNNNTEVYFIAKNPSYTHISEIDYPILKTELDNLYNNAKSYSGATIIECSSINDDNETIQASIIALKNIDLIESEWGL